MDGTTGTHVNSSGNTAVTSSPPSKANRVRRIGARQARRARGAAVGILCAIIAWCLSQLPMMRGLEDWLFDGAFVVRGQRATSSRLLLVDVDDGSLHQLHRPSLYLSPQLATVIGYLNEQGALAIGVDVLIPEAYSALSELQRDATGDATVMGERVQSAGNVVLPEWQVSENNLVRPLIQWQFRFLDEPDANGTDFGFVNFTEDGDRFVRRQQLAVNREHGPAGLAFAAALLARARKAPIVWDSGKRVLSFEQRAIPLDVEQMMRINFVGPSATFPTISLLNVLTAVEKKEAIPDVRGAIVIVGSISASGQDVHNTPYSNRYADHFFRLGGGLMSGPELHANIIATLEDRAFITTPWWLSPLPWFLLTGAALGQAFFRLGLGSGFALATVHHFGWKILAWAAFFIGHWRVEMGGMFVLGGARLRGRIRLALASAQRGSSAVKSAPIAQALEMDPNRLRWGAKRVRSRCSSSTSAISRAFRNSTRPAMSSRFSTPISARSSP